MIGEALYQGVKVSILERKPLQDEPGYGHKYLIVFNSEPIWIKGEDLEDARLWFKEKISATLLNIKIAKKLIKTIRGSLE